MGSVHGHNAWPACCREPMTGCEARASEAASPIGPWQTPRWKSGAAANDAKRTPPHQIRGADVTEFRGRIYSAKPSTMNALEFVVLPRMALISFMSDASAQPCAFSLLSKARTTRRAGGVPSIGVIVVDRMT